MLCQVVKSQHIHVTKSRQITVQSRRQPESQVWHRVVLHERTLSVSDTTRPACWSVPCSTQPVLVQCCTWPRDQHALHALCYGPVGTPQSLDALWAVAQPTAVQPECWLVSGQEDAVHRTAAELCGAPLLKIHQMNVTDDWTSLPSVHKGQTSALAPDTLTTHSHVSTCVKPQICINILHAVPPIHAVSYHGYKFRSIFSDNLQPIATRRKKSRGTLLVDKHCGNGCSIKCAPLSVSY